MAARRTHVPKFGNWDANDHMPYTVVFDNARQGRGKPINPNDPQQNPDMFPAQGRGGGGGGPITGRRHFNPNDPQDDGADHNLHPQEKPHPERQPQERQQQEKPTNNQQGTGGIVREGSGGSGSGSGSRGSQQPHQVAAGAAERRRVSASSGPGGNVPSRAQSADVKRPNQNALDRNVESPSTSFSADQSPAHPSGLQGGRPATTRLGGNSPAYDPTRRKSTGQQEEGHMFAPATPNRSRLSQRNGNNSAPREEASGKGSSAALPKFGAWDAQDPGSGDGFTVIFNNARNEKKSGGPVNIARTPDKNDGDLYGDSHNVGVHKGHGGSKSWFCCYGSSDVKA